MAKRGRRIVFHGAYEHQADAKKKERELRRRGLDPYIERRAWRVRGRRCGFLVLTTKEN